MHRQAWSARGYATHARFVSELANPLIDLLEPRPGERILDLGCGDGHLTLRIAERGAEVVGVDASVDMVDAARQRGIDARQMDGRALGFVAEFDAVLTNAALHWMGAGDAVLAGVRRSLRRGGRFVGEFGGHGNVAAVVTALIAALRARGIDGAARLPWSFPTAETFRRRLAGHGFAIEQIALIPRPTPLPTGIEGWLDTFADPFFAGFDGAARAAVVAEVRDLLAPSLRDEDGTWVADYVRLRFVARLP